MFCQLLENGSSALNLNESYLKNRQQCIKIGPFSSNWQNMIKGVNKQITNRIVNTNMPHNSYDEYSLYI
jgi:hypothetical protein